MFELVKNHLNKITKLILILVGWKLGVGKQGGGVMFSRNNSKTLKAITLAIFSIGDIRAKVSLTPPSLQIFGKTQTGVFPISGFLVSLL